MDQGEYDFFSKILIIGDAGTGKSNLVSQYANNEYSESYCPTTGVDFATRSVTLEGKITKLEIWDTAGQQRFPTITSSYYEGAQGIIILYDITDKESFNNVKHWIEQIEKFASDNVVKLLVGNKCDYTTERKVDFDTASKYADQLGISVLETSAKTGTNVDHAFSTIAFQVRQKSQPSQNNPDKDGDQ